MPQEFPPDFLVLDAEVERALSALKTGKALGPDFIPNRILKESAFELAPVVRAIFNSSMAEGYFPDLLMPD